MRGLPNHQVFSILQRKTTRQLYEINPLLTSTHPTLSFIMSTQLIKWWKAKFQSSTTCGYKNITVLGSDTSDGKHSDTEDLVRDDTSSTCNLHGAHINAGLATSSASSEHSINHHSTCSINEVKFEDFECDVQFEGNEPGEARKEFSFTFYDLDGHGKVTKDDIAGLVRSIYGAVNESITVPQGGKKTIKVRLTVTPEKGKGNNNHDCNNKRDSSPSPPNNTTTTPNNNNNNNNNKFSPSNEPPSHHHQHHHSNNSRSHKLRNNVNVTIQENLNTERRFRHGDKLKFSSVRIPNHLTGCRGCRNLSPEVLRDCSASPMRHRKKWRERSCSVQRPNLIELLQANMEKNNVSPCCRQSHHIITPTSATDPPCPILPPNPTSLQNNSYNASHHQPPPNNTSNFNFCTTTAGKFKLQLDHHSFVCHNSSGRNKLFDPSSSPSHHQRSSPPTTNPANPPPPHQCKKHTHHRSRSHDLGQTFFKYHLLLDQDQMSTTTTAPNSQQRCNNNHSCNAKDQLNQTQETLELLNGCLFSKTSNIDNNTTPSPHQLKHRNREQEHARAMAQVISWLERDIGIDKKFSKKIPGLHISPPPIKKHEHHHVHEHIHHHYHHYAKETPIIV